MELTQALIESSVEDAVRAAEQLRTPEAIRFIGSLSEQLAEVFERGGKLLVTGNGGSLCDAAHFAEELTGQFRSPRPALAAISLCNAGHMSCVGNDMGFDEIFARGVEAYGKPGDMLCVLTTSGNSPNILRAVEQARAGRLYTAAFLGKDGGSLAGMCDLEWIVEGFSTSDRIQEAHMAAIHIAIEALEKRLFGC